MTNFPSHLYMFKYSLGIRVWNNELICSSGYDQRLNIWRIEHNMSSMFIFYCKIHCVEVIEILLCLLSDSAGQKKLRLMNSCLLELADITSLDLGECRSNGYSL